MISFGSVTHRNLKGDLRNVANVAQSSQNQNVRVQVLRNGKVGKRIQECMLILYQLKYVLAIQGSIHNWESCIIPGRDIIAETTRLESIVVVNPLSQYLVSAPNFNAVDLTPTITSSYLS